MLRTSLLVCGLSMALVGCDDNPTSPSDVVGDSWQLVSLQEAASSTPMTPADSSRYTITFEDDGDLAVRSDCNSCGGTYTISGSSLTISPLACTKVFCGDTSLDTRFTTILQSARSIAADDEVRIEGTAGRLRFEEQ